MGRKTKKKFGHSEVPQASWQFVAALAVGSFVLLYWVIPSTIAANRFAKAFAQGSKLIGILSGLMFGFFALLHYINQKAAKRKIYQFPPTNEGGGSTVRREPSIAGQDAVADTWNDLMAKVKADTVSTKPTEWSLELLRQIEWKRVEELTAAYFREKTFRTETIQAGADGGIDVKLFAGDSTTPYALVQCKAWNTQKVGVKPVRELLGVMTHENVAKGVFVTTGTYTKEAFDFAKQHPITLVTGQTLIKGILATTDDAKARLLAVATEGDYTTPTCPSCGIKMARRESDRGSFWGCRNYPRCKQKLFTKAD